MERAQIRWSGAMKILKSVCTLVDARSNNANILAIVMIVDNEPPLSRYFAPPRDLANITCGSFVAGMIMAALIASGFQCFVTAHLQPLATHMTRTVYLVRFLDAEPKVEK